MKRVCMLIIVAVVCFSIFHSIGVCAADYEMNSLTFINQSGETALVKLVGPSYRIAEIQNNNRKTVKIKGGGYTIYVKYGEPGHHRYTKGESFEIDETSNSFTEAYLTLHGVVNGNYQTEGSTEEEFNRH